MFIFESSNLRTVKKPNSGLQILFTPMRKTKQKIQENLTFSLAFLVFSGLILSIVDAYLCFKNRGFSLYKTMSLLCSLFYGYISYEILVNYTTDMPQWVYGLGVAGIISNILAIAILVASKILKTAFAERNVVEKHFRVEENISTSSARA